MSEREFAKATGRALSTVQEARKAGRLSRSVSKDAKGRIRIDPVLAAAEWAASTSERVTDGADEGGAVVSWKAARARREAALASLAEDELRRRRAELVEAKGLEERLATTFGNVRNKLLGVPSVVRQRDPTLTAAQLALLDTMIREALEDLANGDEEHGDES